jgi:hypothetical protein
VDGAFAKSATRHGKCQQATKKTMRRDPMNVERKVWIAAGLSSLLAFSAHADLPKQGRYDVNLCLGGALPVIAHSDKHLAGVLDLYGPMVSNVPSGLYHLNGIHCQGGWSVIDGVYEENGFCETTDPDGDKQFGRYARTGATGEWKVLSGTGKYAGMSGGGSYTPVGQFAQRADGGLQNCNRATGTYRLR